MTELELLQNYWWLLIAILGGVLVFLLFVQGGQSMLYNDAPEAARQLMVNSLGRKWELTFTTLVVFGGAFFASFPLFYSTSFGGAYWLWMLILFSFVLQAVSYEYRRRRGNLYGTRTYDTFLFINGFVGCVLLGVAVGTLFFGGEFTIEKTNILNSASPVISRWADTRGLEAIVSWRNLLVGLMVFFLARTNATLYFINNISDMKEFGVSLRSRVLINGTVFAFLFIGFVVVLLRAHGIQFENGAFVSVPHLYLKNFLAMWWFIPLFLGGTLCVLWGIYRSAFSAVYRKGIWWTGLGTIVVVVTLFCLAGYNGTAYLPSLTAPDDSLTIANSSSSLFTLKVMAVVSLVIPVVIWYIWYVWSKMNNKPLTLRELNSSDHQY